MHPSYVGPLAVCLSLQSPPNQPSKDEDEEQGTLKFGKQKEQASYGGMDEEEKAIWKVCIRIFCFLPGYFFLRRSAPCGARQFWFLTRWWGPLFSSCSSVEASDFVTTGT